jgi:hypothetical protein
MVGTLAVNLQDSYVSVLASSGYECANVYIQTYELQIAFMSGASAVILIGCIVILALWIHQVSFLRLLLPPNRI